MSNTTRQCDGDITPAIERLRASKQQADARDAELGADVGREWAKGQAEADDLERLSGFRRGIRDLEWDDFFCMPDGSSAYGPEEIVFFAMVGNDDNDRNAASDFWEMVTGRDQTPRSAFVRGFVEGAVEIWDEVKDQI